MVFYFAYKMFIVVLFFWLFTSATSAMGSDDILEALGFIEPAFRAEEELQLDQMAFPVLQDYDSNAKEVTEKQYPWIAHVVHSRTAISPHLCTAVCINEAIFVTAARSMYTAKIKYTSVLYMSERFHPKAFVFTSKPTRQMFDDVGLIVVNTKKNLRMTWAVIQPYKMVNRTDKVFKWFSKLSGSKNWQKMAFKVVGYTGAKPQDMFKPFATQKYKLKVLDVPVVNADICKVIDEESRKKTLYTVPCYHSCTYEQFKVQAKECKNYHGVEGGALFDTVSNTLVGIATWGATITTQKMPKREMPVGFTTLNSDNFFEDYTCAKKIRKDDRLVVTKGYYQTLCNKRQ